MSLCWRTAEPKGKAPSRNRRLILIGLILAILLIPPLVVCLVLYIHPNSNASTQSVTNLPPAADSPVTTVAAGAAPSSTPFAVIANPSVVNLNTTSKLTISPAVFAQSISEKIIAAAQPIPNPFLYPISTNPTTGKWLYNTPDVWTSGFFPATLYAMHNRVALCEKSVNVSDEWQKLGQEWSSGETYLEQANHVEHDVGFLSIPFMQQLKLTPSDATSTTAVVNFATYLANRYSPIVGCTRSWDSHRDPNNFYVIMDNMMNLEVLLVAAKLNGNQTLINIAKSHADKTLQNHVRSDGGSFHLITYSASTGIVLASGTAQGYSNSSTWSRGQAWGIHGFANMYLYTNETRYLDTARKMAAYFILRTPSNGVVPWDFDAPTPTTMDSSAMAIAARGLLLLAKAETNSLSAATWRNASISLLNTVSNVASIPTWSSILANGTDNNRANPPRNQTGLVYGDYYFVEAGNELLRQGLVRC